ncbi:MAG TPA: ParB/RepB/Spo0J family partition protein [Nitrososphaerales archaeon]|nr:ParB/RepB/Spo0J family partition protein [Nitrososphaerales archaeon]
MGQMGIFEELEISKIDFAKNGLRVNVGSIEELASSIAEKGLLQPIVVRVLGDGYEVVAGNRRLSACKLLKWRKILCHIIELDDRESYEVSLIENVQHKTLNPIEEALAFNRYVEEFGWGGVSVLAEKIGRSQEHVSRRLQLLQLPGKVQDKIMRRRISAGIAQELLTIDGKTAEKLAEMIENDHIKRDEVRQIVKSVKKVNSESDKEPKTPPTYEEVFGTTDGALRKCITILKSTLLRIDDVIDEIGDDWITKEMLMQYRMIVHGDIDAFLRLRKRLESKIRPTYTSNTGGKIDAGVHDDESLYMYRGVWQ